MSNNQSFKRIALISSIVFASSVFANQEMKYPEGDLLNTLFPPKQEMNLNAADLLSATGPQQTEKAYVYKFNDYKYPVSAEIENEDEALLQAAKDAVAILKSEAIANAAYELNSILQDRMPTYELEERIRKASTVDVEFIQSFKLTKQENDSEQQLFQRTRPKNIILSGFFTVDREKLKDFIIDTVKVVEVNIDEGEILNTNIPTSTASTHIAYFKNQTKRVPDADKDPKGTITSIVNDLKLQAIKEAADEINFALAQPMNPKEFDRAIQNANKNFQDYVTEFQFTEKPKIEKKRTYSGTIQTISLGAWFAVDKDRLRKTLVDSRAITTVAKYRTYVEAYWNVPDKEINPEIMAVVISNIEDTFSQKGYEVVEFERIKGDLVELLNKEQVSGIYSNDELERFEANLELRNIDKKFENGKRILADYADLLIGVTVNSMESVGQVMKIRLTVDATLFENGEWVKLASTDRSGQTPYIRGNTEALISTAKNLTIQATVDLERKARKQLSLRKAKDTIKLGEEREFSMTFGSADAKTFRTIRKAIRKGSQWNYKGADPQKKIIRVGYRGQIDGLSDEVEDLLADEGIKPGVPEFSSGRNAIVFGKE